jgi:hypothetical protein
MQHSMQWNPYKSRHFGWHLSLIHGKNKKLSALHAPWIRDHKRWRTNT